MPLTNFVDGTPPTVDASWLNAVDVLLVTVFANATTAALARIALGGGTAGIAVFQSATAADVRTAAGVGTIATQNSNNVTITGGSISGITDLAIADGGTGQSTAALAFAALKQAATTAATGVVELATQAELNAGTVSVVPTADLLRIVPQTAQVTTSGTSFNFPGLPSDCSRVTVIFNEVSLSGTDSLLVQIGPSGGVETSTYVSTSNQYNQASATSGTNSTAGFVVYIASAAFICSGVLTIVRISGNLWIASGAGKASTTAIWTAGGSKSLAGALTQVTITRTGTDTFDLGSVTVIAER